MGYPKDKWKISKRYRRKISQYINLKFTRERRAAAGWGPARAWAGGAGGPTVVQAREVSARQPVTVQVHQGHGDRPGYDQCQAHWMMPEALSALRRRGRRAGEITDSNVSARVFELKCLPLRMDAGFRCAMVNLSLLDNMVRLIIAWYNIFNNCLFRFRKSSGSGCQARKQLQDMVRTWDTPT